MSALYANRRHLRSIPMIVLLLVGFIGLVPAGAQLNDHGHIYIEGGADTCETGSGDEGVYEATTGDSLTVTFCIHSPVHVGVPNQPVTWEVDGADIQDGSSTPPAPPPETTTGTAPPGEASIVVKRTTAGSGTVTGRESTTGEPSATIQINWVNPAVHVHLLTAVGSVGNLCHTAMQTPVGNATAASTAEVAANTNSNLIACVHTAAHAAAADGTSVFLANTNFGSATAPASQGPVVTAGGNGQAAFALNSPTAGKTQTVATTPAALTPSNTYTVTWTKQIDHAHVFVQGQGSCESHADPASVTLGTTVNLIACANGVAHDGIADSNSDPSTGDGFDVSVTWSKTAGPGGYGAQELNTNANGQAAAAFSSSAVGTSTVKASIKTQEGGPTTKVADVDINWFCPFNGSLFPFSSANGIYVATGNVDGDACGDLIVGSGENEVPRVKVLRGDGSLIEEFAPYAEGFRGGVRVAAGDVNGDGDDEVITASGNGSSGHIRVWDFSSPATPIAGWFAYPDGFSGGAFVAAGNVSGDANEEIITGAGESGGSHVLVFNSSGATQGSFFAYPDGFYGGVRVGAGDVAGDAFEEIITGAGPSGGPHVRMFSASGGDFGGFFAYPDGFYGGVYVAGGDLVNGGKQEVITGAGQSGGPHVRWFDAAGTDLGGKFVYPSTFYGGVRVAAGDVNGDGLADLVTGAGPSGGAHLRTFLGGF
jgi:hypothetical protein